MPKEKKRVGEGGVGFGNQPPADLLIETVGFQALEDHRVEH